MRECGLKCLTRHLSKPESWSLPVRECGLKSATPIEPDDDSPSLPVRECGLKLLHVPRNPPVQDVTPRAGVWIEIVFLTLIVRSVRVTPRAGVWIEMETSLYEYRIALCHSPLWLVASRCSAHESLS